MTRGHCILVFGVSGVGKSRACEDYVERHPEYLYFRASDLLKAATSKTDEQLRTADKHSIEAHQEVLANEVRARRKGKWERPVIIDAHGVIDNDRTLVRVPVGSVRLMEPNGAILMEADPVTIVDRRQRSIRRRPLRTAAEIAIEIAAEREAVEEYAATLSIPIQTANVIDGFILDESIAGLLDKIP